MRVEWKAGTGRASRSRQSNQILSGEIAMKLSRLMTKTLALLLASSLVLNAGFAQSSKSSKAAVQPDDLKQWLAYLASDELEGRATFSEGLGLAAAYIAEQLRAWGVKPGGDNGSYFQRVR